MTPLWVGVDLGTQSTKVSIVDDTGSVLASAWQPVTSIRSPGRHEQRPREWIESTASAMRAALSVLSTEQRKSIAGVATCSTSGTITTVDRAGVPQSSGLMYDDARASAVVEEVIDAAPELWARLGHRIQPTWALPKMLWSVRSGKFEPGEKFAHQADVVNAAICGAAVATDWSHALKSGYDVIDLRWPDIRSIGLDEDLLPAVVAPGTLLGFSTQDWQEQAGLPEATPVYAGMTDGCAAQISAGTLNVGDWHSVIGTTFVLKGVSSAIMSGAAGAIYSHRAPDAGLWFPGGASNTGAGALSSLLPGVQLDGLPDTVKIEDIPVAYPLTAVGERFPFVDPEAQGFVVRSDREVPLKDSGLDPASLAAAIMFGVACAEKLALDVLESSGAPVDGRLTTSGGGSRNEWWVRLRATVLDREIGVSRRSEGSVGMAIMAAWATQDGSLAEASHRMSPAPRLVAPQENWRGPVQRHVEMFLKIASQHGWV